MEGLSVALLESIHDPCADGCTKPAVIELTGPCDPSHSEPSQALESFDVQARVKPQTGLLSGGARTAAIELTWLRFEQPEGHPQCWVTVSGVSLLDCRGALRQQWSNQLCVSLSTHITQMLFMASGISLIESIRDSVLADQIDRPRPSPEQCDS